MSIISFLSQALNLAKLPSHYELIVITPLVYHFIFLLGGKLSSVIFPNTYNKYTNHEKILWNEHIVHFLNSIVLCILSVPLLLDEDLAKDRLYGYCWGAGNVYAIASGYFIWDLIMCLNRKVPSGFFIFHATLCVFVYLISLTPFLNYYGIRFLLFELSTPFLNLGWFLQKLNLTNTLTFKLNGILLYVVFFLARICWGLYQSYSFWTDAVNVFVEGGPKHLILIIGFANISLNILNIFWFSKLTGMLISMVFKGSKDDKAKVSNGDIKVNGNTTSTFTNINNIKSNK